MFKESEERLYMITEEVKILLKSPKFNFWRSKLQCLRFKIYTYMLDKTKDRLDITEKTLLNLKVKQYSKSNKKTKKKGKRNEHSISELCNMFKQPNVCVATGIPKRIRQKTCFKK